VLRFMLIAALTIFLFAPISRSAEPAAPPAKDPALPALAHSSVSIPWDDLRGLLKKNNAAAQRPPVDFAFSPATYNAVVGDKTAAVTASVDVTLLVDDWTLVPLGPANTGVTSASVDGVSAALVVRDDKLFALVKGKGDKKLSLAISRDIVADAGHRQFDLPLLPSALISLSATIPHTDLTVRAPGGSAVSVADDRKSTTLKATFHGGATASVLWQPAPPAGAAAQARTYADGETLVTVEKGLLRTTTHLRVTVERGAMKEFKFIIDPALTVLAVNAADVAQWKVAAAGAAAGPGAANSKMLIVTFGGDSEAERAIDIVAERDIPNAGGEIELHVPALAGAKRDRGFIGVASAGAFDVRPGKSAADRVSVSELPKTLRSPAAGTAASVQIGYHYVEPAAITLLLEKVKVQPPQIMASTLTRVDVERGGLRCHADINYEILHAGVDTLRVGLPDGIEITAVNGAGIRDTQTVVDGKQRTLVVGLKDLAQGAYSLAIDYVAHSTDAKDSSLIVPVLSNPSAAQDRGFIGIDVRDSVEIVPTPAGAQRIDVKELPEALWSKARSPLLFGYRYDAPGVKISLALTRNADLDVLVAMSDICEASTTYTPDGKSITKMMLVTRNNLKQYMTLKLPEGSAVWSAFVDDHPVTPAKNAKGDVLIPLKKSDPEEADDDDSADGKSYRARRERRRSEPADGRAVERTKQAKADEKSADDAPPDLKPYDVEIVFVTAPMKLADRGQVKAALPQLDIPIGHLSWAIFLPENLRVVDSDGNVSEVSRFTLPFRHFGDVAYERAKRLEKGDAQAEVKQDMEQAAQAQAAKMLAEHAKAEGVLPVRIEIPMIGEIHRYEKFLVVDESPEVALTYNRK
jgi:hypothetical protein